MRLTTTLIPVSHGTFDDVQSADRILCLGVTGSGKSTLARKIGEALNIETVFVDDLSWLPGWRARDQDEFDAVMHEILRRPQAVLDSAYGRHRAEAAAWAQVIVALDYPRWTSLGRLLRRTTWRVLTGERCCNGNVETLRSVFSHDSIVLWHFRSWRRKREQMRALHADVAAAPVILLHNPREADALLHALGG